MNTNNNLTTDDKVTMMNNRYEHLNDNYYKDLETGRVFQLPADAPSVEEYFAIKKEVRYLQQKALTAPCPYGEYVKMKEAAINKLRNAGYDLEVAQSTQVDDL
jgi:hypothetical protein